MKTDLLDIYSDYLISQNHYATSTGLEALFDGEISHDQMSRYLRSDEFDSKNYGDILNLIFAVTNKNLAGYYY